MVDAVSQELSNLAMLFLRKSSLNTSPPLPLMRPLSYPVSLEPCSSLFNAAITQTIPDVQCLTLRKFAPARETWASWRKNKLLLEAGWMWNNPLRKSQLQFS